MTQPKEFEEFDEKFGDESDLIHFLTIKYGTHIHHKPMLNVVKNWISQNFTPNSLIKEKVEGMNKKE